MTNDRERALLVVMPIEDLRSALALVDAGGRVVMPAGGPGDLDIAPVGTPVLLMASNPSGDEVPAATWRADLIGRVAHEPGQSYPEGVPPTWLERHSPAPQEAANVIADNEIAMTSPEGDPDEDPDDPDEDPDDPDEEDRTGPQSFFEIEHLRELPKPEWLFVNELVGKQARGGRTFFARVPMMVHLPD